MFLALITLSLLPTFTALPEQSDTTLYGTYIWEVGSHSPSDLRAEFKAAGENRWQVSFYFRFNGTNHVYSGTAEGQMDGVLKGRVKNESKRRTFEFEGRFNGNEFSGTHWEIHGENNRQRTGTLKLAPNS